MSRQGKQLRQQQQVNFRLLDVHSSYLLAMLFIKLVYCIWARSVQLNVHHIQYHVGSEQFHWLMATWLAISQKLACYQPQPGLTHVTWVHTNYRGIRQTCNRQNSTLVLNWWAVECGQTPGTHYLSTWVELRSQMQLTSLGLYGTHCYNETLNADR